MKAIADQQEMPIPGGIGRAKNEKRRGGWVRSCYKYFTPSGVSKVGTSQTLQRASLFSIAFGPAGLHCGFVTHRPMSKKILVLVAVVNLLVAAIAACELWDFSRFDRSGLLDQTKEEQKTNMLRTIHRWGLPPVILLTGASGFLLWKTAKRLNE